MSVVKQRLQAKMLCSPNIMDSTKHPVYSLYTHFMFMRSIYISKAHCYQQIHLRCFLAFPEQLQGSVNANLIDLKSSVSIIKVFPGTACRVYTRGRRREGTGRRKLRVQGRASQRCSYMYSAPLSTYFIVLLNPSYNKYKGGQSEQGEHPQRRMPAPRSSSRRAPLTDKDAGRRREEPEQATPCPQKSLFYLK